MEVSDKFHILTALKTEEYPQYHFDMGLGGIMPV
jgi:hypothetical protein